MSFVMFTGAGFGAVAGLFYSEDYWWIGVIAGAVSGYPLVRLYLMRLVKIAAKASDIKNEWMSCTKMAVISGVICTTVIHAIMAVIVVANSDMSIIDLTDIYGVLFLFIAEVVGACVGLFVGGICSYIFIVLESKNIRETD